MNPEIPSLPVRACPACGARRGETVGRLDWILFEDHPLGVPVPGAAPGAAIQGIEVCPMCGLGYSSPVADAASFERYYSTWSRYATGTDGLSGPPDGPTLARHRGTVSLVAPRLGSARARILDAGCLEGGLLERFREAGFGNVSGVDPAPESARRGGAAALDVRTGTLESIPFPDASFDLVLCVHVLEHVHDLARLDLFRVLAPGGLLYVEVPDAAAYDPESSDIYFDISLEHINHFDEASLRTFLRRRGFRALETGRRTYPVVPGRPRMQDSVYGIFQRGQATEPADSAASDLRQRLADYLAASRRRAELLDRRLAEFLAGEGTFSLWGTGHAAFRMLGLPSLRGAGLRAATDGNPLYWGKTLAGARVVPPQDIAAFADRVVVTSSVHGAAIASRLAAMGWGGKVFVP